MSRLDKTIHTFFETSIIIFASIAIFSTVSVVSFSDDPSTPRASMLDMEESVPADNTQIEWLQIDDKMVPVEFLEFPPMYVSVNANTLYID